MNIWQSYGQNGWLRHSLHSPRAFPPTMQNSPRKGYPHKRQHSRWKLGEELKGKILLATFFAKYTCVEMGVWTYTHRRNAHRTNAHTTK